MQALRNYVVLKSKILFSLFGLIFLSIKISHLFQCYTTTSSSISAWYVYTHVLSRNLCFSFIDKQQSPSSLARSSSANELALRRKNNLSSKISSSPSKLCSPLSIYERWLVRWEGLVFSLIVWVLNHHLKVHMHEVQWTPVDYETRPCLWINR